MLNSTVKCFEETQTTTHHRSALHQMLNKTKMKPDDQSGDSSKLLAHQGAAVVYCTTTEFAARCKPNSKPPKKKSLLKALHTRNSLEFVLLCTASKHRSRM